MLTTIQVSQYTYNIRRAGVLKIFPFECDKDFCSASVIVCILIKSLYILTSTPRL